MLRLRLGEPHHTHPVDEAFGGPASCDGDREPRHAGSASAASTSARAAPAEPGGAGAARRLTSLRSPLEPRPQLRQNIAPSTIGCPHVGQAAGTSSLSGASGSASPSFAGCPRFGPSQARLTRLPRRRRACRLGTTRRGRNPPRHRAIAARTARGTAPPRITAIQEITELGSPRATRSASCPPTSALRGDGGHLLWRAKPSGRRLASGSRSEPKSCPGPFFPDARGRAIAVRIGEQKEMPLRRAR